MSSFLAGFFYLGAVLYTLMSAWFHSGSQEMVTDTLSREDLYAIMAGAFAVFGLLTELMSEG